VSPAAASALGERLASVAGADAVDSAPLGPGGAALPRVAPGSEDELAELLRLAAAERLAVVPCGLGSKLGWTRPARRADLLVSTRRLAGIVHHDPADGTLAALAGTPMSVVRDAALEGGHWLTPDVCAPQRKTLAGVVSAGESGLDRLRFGPARHHVLGTRVMLADGTVARSGGRLVKNVTGFDLHRLHAGSHGTLAIVLEVALRLFTAPVREALVSTGAADATGAIARVRAALALPARLTALWMARLDPPTRGATWAVFARLGGKDEAVAAELEALRAAWTPCAVLEGDEARAEAEALREKSFEAGGAPWLRGLCRPSRCEAALAALERRLDETGLNARLLAQPGDALVDAQLAPEADADTVARLVGAWREDLARLEGRVELRDAPAAVLARVDPFGPAPVGGAWMHRLKDALDPHGVLATGRLAGGL
jgi:glycolate oxidase FAD binding subunit